MIDIPPPPPDPGAHAPPREIRPAIPVSPAHDDQVPHHALRQRQQDLISDRDVRHRPVRVRVRDGGEVALLEAQVGQRGEVAGAAARAEDVGGDARWRCAGGRGARHDVGGDLAGGGGGGVDVVVWIGVVLDRGGLDHGGEFGGGIVRHFERDNEA